MKRARKKRQTALKAITLSLSILLLGIWWAAGETTNASVAETPGAEFVSSAQRYSKFSHDVEAHKKLDCSKCHTFPTANWKTVRKGDDAFPDVTDYPKHASCINCHRQQFFRGSPPAICSICHTNPGPRNSARHPFPDPREIFVESPKGAGATSAFNIYFSHDLHVDMFAAGWRRSESFINAGWRATGPRNEESCAVCHQTIDPQGD